MATPASEIARLNRWLQRPLVIAAVVLLALGLDLTLLPRDTDRFFSWTIKPALTSGVLGAFYLSAFLLLVVALRGWVWARVKVVLPGGITFSALAIIATFMHFSKFHVSDASASAKVVAWIWILAYLALPPALLFAIPAQLRMPGRNPERTAAPGFANAGLMLIATAMTLVGAWLFIAPMTVARWWPWVLTPLTGRVLGAWTVGLGLVFLRSAASRDAFVALPSFIGAGIFGVFELSTLLRFSDDIDLGSPAAISLIVFLLVTLIVGVAGSIIAPKAVEQAGSHGI